MFAGFGQAGVAGRPCQATGAQPGRRAMIISIVALSLLGALWLIGHRRRHG